MVPFMISTKVNVIKSEMDSVLLDYAMKVSLHSSFHLQAIAYKYEKRGDFSSFEIRVIQLFPYHVETIHNWLGSIIPYCNV